MFAAWVNKDNISLQGDVRTHLLTASYKKVRYPRFRVPQLWCQATASTESILGTSRAPGAGGWGDRGDWWPVRLRLRAVLGVGESWSFSQNPWSCGWPDGCLARRVKHGPFPVLGSFPAHAQKRVGSRHPRLAPPLQEAGQHVRLQRLALASSTSSSGREVPSGTQVSSWERGTGVFSESLQSNFCLCISGYPAARRAARCDRLAELGCAQNMIGVLVQRRKRERTCVRQQAIPTAAVRTLSWVSAEQGCFVWRLPA